MEKNSSDRNEVNWFIISIITYDNCTQLSTRMNWLCEIKIIKCIIAKGMETSVEIQYIREMCNYSEYTCIVNISFLKKGLRLFLNKHDTCLANKNEQCRAYK